MLTASVERSKLSLEALTGSFEDGVFTIDTMGPTQGQWQLHTWFVIRDTPAAVLARRVCVAVMFDLHADPEKGSLHEPLHIAVENKWHPEGFSVDVSHVVDSADTSKPVRTGIDRGIVVQAAESRCFGEGASGNATGIAAEGSLQLVLPPGVTLRVGATWLEIALAFGGNRSVVCREFSAAGAQLQITLRNGQ